MPFEPDHEDVGFAREQEELADRPYGVRPYGVRPYGVRPYGVRPYGVRPYGVRPYGVRPYGVRPYGVRPYDVRPYGVRQGEHAEGGFLDPEEWSAEIAEVFCERSAVVRLGATIIPSEGELPVGAFDADADFRVPALLGLRLESERREIRMCSIRATGNSRPAY